jgi:hypothetical protein
MNFKIWRNKMRNLSIIFLVVFPVVMFIGCGSNKPKNTDKFIEECRSYINFGRAYDPNKIKGRQSPDGIIMVQIEKEKEPKDFGVCGLATRQQYETLLAKAESDTSKPNGAKYYSDAATWSKDSNWILMEFVPLNHVDNREKLHNIFNKWSK